MKQSYAYYPGCLASLSQKELDTSTRAIAEKMGAEIYSEGMLSDKGARHAQVFDMSTRATGYLLETALVPYTDPLKAMDVKFALNLARAGKVPNPLKPHRAKKLDEVRKLHKLLKTQEAAARDERRAGVSVDREEPAE